MFDKNVAKKIVSEAAPGIWEEIREYMDEDGEVVSAQIIGDMVLEAFLDVAEDRERLAFYDLVRLDAAAAEDAVRSQFKDAAA